ncbi:MAG: hypothetical protein ACI8TA_001283 [Cyclobacteriaceae bacterium]|jgi:hypothetical protein
MKKTNKKASTLALGLVFGTILGVALDNIGLWMSLGILIGAAFNYAENKDKAENQDD